MFENSRQQCKSAMQSAQSLWHAKRIAHAKEGFISQRLFFFFLPDRQHELAQKPYHSYVPLTQLSAITVTSTGGPKYKLHLSVSSKSIKEYPAPPGF